MPETRKRPTKSDAAPTKSDAAPKSKKVRRYPSDDYKYVGITPAQWKRIRRIADRLRTSVNWVTGRLLTQALKTDPHGNHLHMD